MTVTKSRMGITALVLVVSLFFPQGLPAQEAPDAVQQEPAPPEVPPQKFALVIGNGTYTGIAPLASPVNDALRLYLELLKAGFDAEPVMDGNLEQMAEAVARFKDKIGTSENSYGFFFYAGHAVQSGGVNYLIPISAEINGESDLRTRAVSVQTLLDDLNEKKNILNMVVLDACWGNPFGWGGEQGLTATNRQGGDSIIVYAAAAGRTVTDRESKNSVFATQLLKNLGVPGLDVKELVDRTRADVSRESGRRQVPAVYNRFNGTAYLVPPRAGGPEPVKEESDPTRLWSVGAAVGSSFATPVLIGTVHGTIAPWRYSFFEIGFDAGFLSGHEKVESYYSFYPFVHYAFFMPFKGDNGWYAGAGGGYMIATYGFPKKDEQDNTWGVDLCAGIIIMNMFTASYTLRTNFASANHKVAVGYVRRFK